MIEQSREYITHRYKWTIDEDTFVILNAAKGYWAAKVSTTYMHYREEPEEVFLILVMSKNYYILDEELPILAQWCSQYSN
jgi:hypothetical protein